VLFQLGKAQFESSARPINLTNVYYVPDKGVNLISVDRLFQVKVIIYVTPQSCRIKTKNKVLTAISKNGCWFLDTVFE
jgi:hypothetical protein